jgi:hypothetical protein
MESTGPNRRFPPPWSVEKTEHGYVVQDSNGITLAHIYCRDDLHKSQWRDYQQHLTSDEARRIAKAIARIPEFMIRAPGFYSRQGGDKRWKPSRPYHVALQDWLVREQWDRISALCAYNGVPIDPTGERINRDGHWCVCTSSPGRWTPSCFGISFTGAGCSTMIFSTRTGQRIFRLWKTLRTLISSFRSIVDSRSKEVTP